MPYCRSCKKQIVWIRTAKNNKIMPCNPDLVTVTTAKGETVRGYVSHYATCSDADRFRGKGEYK